MQAFRTSATRDPEQEAQELRNAVRDLHNELKNLATVATTAAKEDEIARYKVEKNILDRRLQLDADWRKLVAKAEQKEKELRIRNLEDIYRQENKLHEQLLETMRSRQLGFETEQEKRRAEALKQRLADEEAVANAAKRASDYLDRIPLIGKKLGERGNILDVFQQIDTITDKVTGKLVNTKNAAEVYGVGKRTADQVAWAQQQGVGAGKKFKTEADRQKYIDTVQKEEKDAQAGAKALASSIKDDAKAAKKGDAEAQKRIAAYEKLVTNLANAGDEKERQKAVNAYNKETGRKGADKLSEKQLTAAEAQLAASEATKAGWANTTAILANLAQKLEGKMDELALDKARVDTRLYGSRNNTAFGSYWSAINQRFAPLMLSPLVKMESVMNNVKTVIDMGIARDFEQVAMLASIKDKIAQTFDAFDGSVRRLIKIQDETTSAARLGMESMLNKFLNNMYETTEYLKNIASQVRSSLVEAEALMDAHSAVDFEFQVQKWLGSLSSVGVSDSGISSIASALGQLAAGQVEGITNGGVGNLLIMAANNGNLSIADILADGLDASETNVLLNQMVGYMHDLVVEANGNKVVQQQLAKVFGLTAADLRAAQNLIYEYNGQKGQMASIFNTGGGREGYDIYNAGLKELWGRADTMFLRTSVGEMLTNVWDNIQFSTAASMASNPAFYIAMKVADILDTFAGGIPIPSISVMGNGVDTKLTVSNIMKAASMVGGFTQSLIGAIGGMFKGNSGFGTGLLKMVGIQNQVTRGASTSQSDSGTVYNASVEDTTGSATQQGKDQAKQERVSAQEESTDVTNETLNESIVNIYNLLNDVVNGANTLSVSLDKINLPFNAAGSLPF